MCGATGQDARVALGHRPARPADTADVARRYLSRVRELADAAQPHGYSQLTGEDGLSTPRGKGTHSVAIGMWVRVGVVGAAASVLGASFVCTSEAYGDDGVSLEPLKSRHSIPETRTARVALAAKPTATSEIVAASITAVRRDGPGRATGRSSVRLGEGRWSVTRSVTFVRLTPSTITPTPGQCSVTKARYSDAFDGYTDLQASCVVNGQRATSSTIIELYQASHRNVLALQRDPVGQDLVAALTDVTNYQWPIQATPMPVPSLTVEVQSPPETVRDKATVTVTTYNPGCVTDREVRRLHIGMARSAWQQIAGGRGTLLARGRGIEVRDFTSCYWSAIDGVTVRYVYGAVDAYAIGRDA